MGPDDREFADEIRGHLALSVQERIERGEDPEAARLAALREFGNVTLARESMRDVWRPQWLGVVLALGQDCRIALRSLCRSPGTATAIVVTLALGIGANAAIFSVVREVLLRPLVNRDAGTLIYVRQSAPGLGAANVTFSVPELRDLRARVKTLSAFADFSTVDFTMVGLGAPRVVKAGVVSGSFFDVMGLRPVRGRLLNTGDDGAEAASVAVLTHRFWTTSLAGDPAVVGRTIRLGTRSVRVVGVLEPAVPYPEATEIIANVVTSPHHLEATMVTGRTHRMTELFGRLAPGATLEDVRAELDRVHAAMVREHPDAYSAAAAMAISATRLSDQLAAPARPVLLILLAAAGAVFIIACANVANLILARAVRREGELAVRAALGASRSALRRLLLEESLVLCTAGAVLGVLLAYPLVGLLGRFASRFSVRALDVTVDSGVLWTGAALAVVAAVVLAYVPRLPSPRAPANLTIGGGSRITPGTSRRLRAFAVTQVALSFLLVAGSAILLSAFIALRTAETGYDMQNVLALDVPLPIETDGTEAVRFVARIAPRIQQLPGVERLAVGNVVPWRDAGSFGPGIRFDVEGRKSTRAEDAPHARFRIVSPGFFATTGVRLIAGRDFTSDDRRGGEPVVIVSQSVAGFFPDGSALNRHLWWTDPFYRTLQPRRVVGVVADADDENVVPQRALAVYQPFGQLPFAGRLFVRVNGDPYELAPQVSAVIQEVAADQPVERAATLADVRAEVLEPERLNVFVFSGFAAVSLLVAVVGVAGVLAFSVSARTHEFGVRLALGSAPGRVMAGVLSEGALIVATGIAAGAAGGLVLFSLAATLVGGMQPPGVLPVAGAAGALALAAIAASLLPAARASRIGMQALRSE